MLLQNLFSFSRNTISFKLETIKRLGLSSKPVDSKGRFDERGDQFNLGNELMGIAGLRRVEVNPQKSLEYKITDLIKKDQSS